MSRLAPLAERRVALEARHPVWTPCTLHEALDAAAARWPDRPYVITDRVTYTYAEIRVWSLRLASGLVAIGIQPGERVGLEMGNYPEFVACKYAISRTGATAIPINFVSRREELARVLGHSQAVALIVMARSRGLDYVGMLDSLVGGWETRGGAELLPILRQVVVFENEGAEAPKMALTLAHLERTAPAQIDLPTVDPHGTADVLHTSGTTNGSRGVQLTHDTLLRAAYAAAHGRGFEDGRRIHFALPMYSAFGYVEGLLPALYVGGAIIPHTAFNPVATLAAIERHRATDMLATPLMTQAVMDALKDHPTDLSSLASVTCSGTAAPPSMWDRIDAELGCDEVTTGCGMSKATAFSGALIPLDDGLNLR